MSTIDRIREAADDIQQAEFEPYEEEAIISLAFDHPEFFSGVGRFLQPQMFIRPECKAVLAEILELYEKHNIIPRREMVRDHIHKWITEDHDWESILGVLERPSDPRDVPIVKDTLLEWARHKAYSLLFTPDAQDAYSRRDYQYLEELLNQANRIADIGQRGFWFFENFETLFDPDVIDHRTTGFPTLDKYLNNGGPSPKEVVCWLAATNVGKSIILCNNAISSLQGIGRDKKPGQDVLLITFELDTIKTAMRCLGAATSVPLHEMGEHRDYVTRLVKQMQKTYNRRFAIFEWPPDECSVAHVYALLDNLKRTEGWRPDVIILDYMDLMVSRVPAYNKDDYTRQKHVANEIRGLAKNEYVLVYTATQTNRDGANSEVVDLTKAAESFAKQFSLDYVVSLNQSEADRQAKVPQIRFRIAKNRNGPKNETVTCSINYNTMLVKELL